jgi:hypothetical protein
MTFPRLQEPFRHILWATALAAALGAAYSQIQVYQRGGQPLAVYFLARGALTGAVIASVLTSFNAFVFDGMPGARLRRAPFTVHVAVKTVIYLGIILFGLNLAAISFRRRTRTALSAETCCSLSQRRSCSSSSST